MKRLIATILLSLIAFALFSQPIDVQLAKENSVYVQQDYVADQYGNILADASDGKIIVKLPPVGLASGREYVIEKLDNSSYSVVLVAFDGERIGNLTAYAIRSKGQRLKIKSDGVKWIY